ncbi:MAG: creatininase family protein [Defluviitaleaceae bacterium]|nr:creatininase family protein [Defluviitaleaceae bacterium]
MNEVRYEYMYPPDFKEAVRRCPVFFIPTGLLEWHGNHLPLGQDTLKAYGLCLTAAKKLGGGIVLPPQYFGRPGFSTYTGTLTYTEEMLYQLFIELFGQLKKAGAKVIVLLTGHYGNCQVDFIKKTASDYSEKNPDVFIIARPEYEGVLIDGTVPADHAGKWETSMFWAMYPEYVRWETYETIMSDMKIYKNAPLDYFQENELWDFGEDLRELSSVALGKRAIEAITEKLVIDIKEALLNADRK